MYYVHIQGGAGNRGLFLCGNATAAVGHCEWQDKSNLLGGGLSDGITVAAGTGGPRCRCRHGDGLLPNHYSELYTEWKNMKISEGLSNSKNMVFNVRKLLKAQATPHSNLSALCPSIVAE
jgi:hypothetical protein